MLIYELIEERACAPKVQQPIRGRQSCRVRRPIRKVVVARFLGHTSNKSPRQSTYSCYILLALSLFITTCPTQHPHPIWPWTSAHSPSRSIQTQTYPWRACNQIYTHGVAILLAELNESDQTPIPTERIPTHRLHPSACLFPCAETIQLHPLPLSCMRNGAANQGL